MSDNSKSEARRADLSVEIAAALRDEIVQGTLAADDRLPSEAELCAKYDVSRSTVREALKILGAQSLIRTRRGATGGAFVNQLRYEDSYFEMASRATLLLSMNEVDFQTACRARFALEKGCADLSAQNRTPDHLAAMHAELHRQGQPDLSDEAFCASDVAFHRAFVDGAQNPVLSWTLASAVEGMQPLMNMITYRARDREKIMDLHRALIHALEIRDGKTAEDVIDRLCDQTISQAKAVRESLKHR